MMKLFTSKFFAGVAFSLFALTGSAMAAVEVNSADQAALDSIAGIGPSTSKAILEERTKHGNYKDWADLERRVKGIGERNSGKLSAAGLMVNGQARPASMMSPKASLVSKTEKSEKMDKPMPDPRRMGDVKP